MENAGTFSVKAEVIFAEVMIEISKRTTLITSSLGSRSGADIIYLFQNDICGEHTSRSRHARAFGNLHALHEQMKSEQRAALQVFCEASLNGNFPRRNETAHINPNELNAFWEMFDKTNLR